MPPVIFVISVLLIFIIYKYLNYILIPKNLFVYILAILLIIIGIVFIISTFYSFHKHKVDIHPFRKPKVLIDRFPFSITRNPIYLSFLMFLISICLFLRSFIGLIIPISFYLFMTKFVIKMEEKIIKEKFNDIYIKYLNEVRRWI